METKKLLIPQGEKVAMGYKKIWTDVNNTETVRNYKCYYKTFFYYYNY